MMNQMIFYKMPGSGIIEGEIAHCLGYRIFCLQLMKQV